MHLSRISHVSLVAMVASVSDVLPGPVPLAAAEAQANLVSNGSFEGGRAGAAAAGWTLHDGVSVERAAAYRGEWGLRVKPVKDATKANYVTLPKITVKPETGYVARCRFRLPRSSAHYTFGILKRNGAFLVCRDAYAGSRPEWDESVLPFRTGNESTVGIYVGRRYGIGEIWFDAIELIEDDRVQIGDVSPRPNPFPDPTPEEKKRGYILSRQHWMRLVYPTTYPTRAEVCDKLSCRLAPGEHEPVTLSLTAIRPLTQVRIRLSEDLSGPKGAVIPSASVSVGIVRTITRWLTSGAPLQPGQRYERRPLFVFPAGSAKVPARETRQFWLTVFAPPDARPGQYRGSLTLAASGTPEVRLPLQVDVLPIKLALPEVTYGMYYRHHCQYPEFRTGEFFKRTIADMKAHGMNSFSVYADLSERKPNRALELNFDGGTPYHYPDRSCGLNWQMDILAEHGLLSPSHPLLLLGDHQFTKSAGLIAPLSAYRGERHWPEFLLYLADEPSSTKQIEMAKRLNDIAHSVAGVRTVTAIGKPGVLAQYYDVWIVTTSVHPISDVVEEAEKLGKEAWTYNCQWNGNQPRNDRFFTGYHMWTQRLRGNWQWCYTERGSGRVTSDGKLELGVPGYEDPWRVSYVLPTPKGNIPTLGWEARREGVDDYRYLQTLRDAIRKARDSDNAALRREARQARAFLTTVARRAKAPARRRPAAQPDCVYNFMMHPGLEPDGYDAIRRQAAEHIARLQRAE